MLVPLEPAHASLLAALHIAAHGSEAPWSAASYRTVLGTPGTFGFLDDTPAGFVLLRRSGDDVEVMMLAVSAGFHRQGRGRALLGRAVAAAREIGAARVLLEVAEDNAAAQALYAGAGFARLGRRRGYYRRRSGSVDALVLVRALAPPAVGTATQAPADS